jgi:hypothetical protein
LERRRPPTREHKGQTLRRSREEFLGNVSYLWRVIDEMEVVEDQGRRVAGK